MWDNFWKCHFLCTTKKRSFLLLAKRSFFFTDHFVFTIIPRVLVLFEYFSILKVYGRNSQGMLCLLKCKCFTHIRAVNICDTTCCIYNLYVICINHWTNYVIHAHDICRYVKTKWYVKKKTCWPITKMIFFCCKKKMTFSKIVPHFWPTQNMFKT